MDPVVKVAIVGATGATGATGQSIVDGLLNSLDTTFEITAFIRPQSITKPTTTALQNRGIRILPVDVSSTPHATLVQHLQDIDVVISAIYFNSLEDEIPLANAAKDAGVKRFVQSAFMVIVPPRGVVDFRERKQSNLHHIQLLHLPYTYIDAGWWYQLTLPRLPSGRIDSALPSSSSTTSSTGTEPVPIPVALDGTVPSALADLRDVGRYVARIVVDPRTLNRKVHVWNEVWTRNEIIESTALSNIQKARDNLTQNRSAGDADILALVAVQLFYSWGVRGDNTPEYADYLGYLSSKNLYPEFEYTEFRSYVEVLGGRARGVYQG